MAEMEDAVENEIEFMETDDIPNLPSTSAPITAAASTTVATVVPSTSDVYLPKNIFATYFSTTLPKFNFLEDNHCNYSKLNCRSAIPELRACNSNEEQTDADLEFEEIFDLFAKFPFESSVPLPFLTPQNPTPVGVFRGFDPAEKFINKKWTAINKFMKSKKQLNRRKEQLCRDSSQTVKLIDKKLSQKKTTMQVPKTIVNLTKAVDADPDPVFVSNYDWYLTGGALAVTSINDRMMLFVAGGEDLGSLVSVPIIQNSTLPTGLEPQEKLLLTKAFNKSQIFEICAKESDNGATVILRWKTSCGIFKYCHEETPDLQLLHETALLGSDSYTSVHINPWNPAECLTSSRLRVVQLWNANSGNEELIEVPALPDYLETWAKGRACLPQWNKANFSRYSKDVIHFAYKSSLISIDRREKPATYNDILNIKNNYNLTNELLSCEAISFSCESKVNANVHYVATSHCLFSVDTRMPNKPLQSWKHCLQEPPVFISQSCYSEGCELLFLCSSLQKEMICIENDWRGQSPQSRAQPKLLPTTLHSIKEANKLGKWSNPSLKSRLMLRRVGLSCTDSNTPNIFSLNSSGDVFCQRLKIANSYDTDMLSQEDLLNTISTWETAVCEIDSELNVPPLRVGAVWNASNVFRNVLSQNDDLNAVIEIENQEEEDDAIPCPPWMLTTEELLNSKDFLSPNLLNAWGIASNTDLNAHKVAAFGEVDDLTLSQKRGAVEEWLAASALATAEAESQDTNIPDTESQIFSQELVSVSQMEIPDSQMILEEIGPEAALDKDVLKTKLFSKYAIIGMKSRRRDGF